MGLTVKAATLAFADFRGVTTRTPTALVSIRCSSLTSLGLRQPDQLNNEKDDMKTKETDLDHYNALRGAAEHASHRTGVLVKVKLAEYWIGGRQQTDHYSVTEPDSVRGPMSFQAAHGYLDGLR